MRGNSSPELVSRMTELLYGKIYTTRLDTGTRREHDTNSDAVHLVFRYQF